MLCLAITSGAGAASGAPTTPSTVIEPGVPFCDRTNSGSAPARACASQSISGRTTSNCYAGIGIDYPCANLFYLSADGVDASSPNNAFDEWQFRANFGGSSLKGNRQTVDISATFTAPSHPANTGTGYGALAAEMFTNSGDGGSAPTIVNGRGSFFGSNPVVVANAGARNLFGIVAEEANVNCNGCSSAIRFGVSAVNGGTSQAAIPGNDAAFHVGSSVSRGGSWRQALNLSHVNGMPPLDADGCVICTDSNHDAIATGFDLSAYTITGNLLKGANGFAVTGGGVLRKAATTFAGLGAIDPSPAVGDELVITDASDCTANTAVTAGGGTRHSCPVIYTGGATPWIAIVTH